MSENTDNIFEEKDEKEETADSQTTQETTPEPEASEEAVVTGSEEIAAAAGASINWGKEIWDWVLTIALAIAITLVIKAFLFDIVKVDGASMFPTLVDSDRLIVNKIAYKPHNGDIIILDSNYTARMEYIKNKEQESGKEMSGWDKFVFRFTQPNYLKPRYYVKRIIAMGGQEINFVDGKVVLDGEVLDEPYYTGETTVTNPGMQGVYPKKITDGYVFVMGDNRNRSLDSRASLGLVSEDAILGHAVFRIFPFNKLGTVK